MNYPTNLFNLKLPPYKSGLVHNIYRSGGFILKIAKPSFPDFNNPEHFETEKNSLRLLRKKGIPVPKKIQTVKLNRNKKTTYGIIETFVRGTQFSWGKLSKKHLLEIVNLLDCGHKIPVKGAGPLNHCLIGKFTCWKDFLFYSYDRFIEEFPEKENKNLLFKLKKVTTPKNPLNKNPNSFFLFVDPNPGNVIFNTSSSINAVIDIDHPYGGDPLYDYASIKWYSPNTFLQLTKLVPFLKSKSSIINFYSFLHGANVLCWMKRHNLDYRKDLIKLKKLLKTISV